MNRNSWQWALVSSLILAGCGGVQRPPIHTVPHVELPRFMGDWYVIANIPTFVETDAYNAVESYRLDADGTIATTFTFRQGSYDGASKRHRPGGFVLGIERMQVLEEERST
jgi:apolipoprotein D and lipocalin family protein